MAVLDKCRARWLYGALLITALLAGCNAKNGRTEKTGGIMDKWHVSEECDFTAFAAGVLEECACSPEIDDFDFRGIVLNAPETVMYEPGESIEGSRAFADVRVCGTACFDYAFMGLKGRVQRKILLVVVDAETQETYSGKLPGIDNAVAPPAGMPRGDGPTDGLVVESYFNPNLAEILNLPEREAEYIVYATLGEYKSNTVRIRIEKRD